MRIITISRQFGSGGRELGKRLADFLGWDYYDKEIIDTLSQDQGLDADYVRRTLSEHGWHDVQLTYRNSFSHLGFDHGVRTRLLVREREIIREIAEAGNDCIIVGRNADVILEDYGPFRVEVCADEEARLARCMAYEKKKPETERLSEKEVLRNIRRIDRIRRRTREIVTGKKPGDASVFDLTVNAAGWEIKALTPAVAAFAGQWFAEQDRRNNQAEEQAAEKK